MGAVERIGPGAPPPAVMAILNRFNRDELGNAIEVLVALLDVQDGDADLEDGDEDGQCSEDEISTNLHARYGEGAGCPIADPDKGVDDDGEETNQEDSFWLPHYARNGSGPGCPIADPDYGHDGS